MSGLLMLPPGKPEVLHSESDEFGTPGYIFDPLDDEFHFTIDVAASYKNTKISRYITKEDDALAQDWLTFGCRNGETNTAAWCNPPYSRENVARFVAKAKEESDKGLIVAMLLPARTEQSWFHDIVLPHAEVRFIRKRVKHLGGESSARFPSLVAIFPRYRIGAVEHVQNVVAMLEPRCVA